MKFAPTNEQLERLAEFRAAVGEYAYDATDDNYAALAALLGLPKPEPQPEELSYKYLRYEGPDEEDFEAKPGDYTDTYSTEPGEEDVRERKWSDDFIKRSEEHEAQVKAAKAKVDAEQKAYDEKREASCAAAHQWGADNVALVGALSDWIDYFFRLDNPKEAKEQDAEDAIRRREEIAKVLPNLKRFLKLEVAYDTIPDLVANAYSEWQSLAEETRQNQENMEEHFPSKAEEWGECADTLENFSEPTVPDKFKETQIAYFVEKYRGSRDGRNTYACDQLDLVIDYLQDHEHEDDEGLASDLEDAKGEAESLNFPGMYG